MDYSFSLQQIVHVLKANFRLGAFIVATVVALAVAASLLLPKRYTATATVMVDTKPKDQIDGTTAAGPTGSAYLATQADLIRSERVSRIVINRLNLAGNPETREMWEEETKGAGDYIAWLAGKLNDKLSVTPSKDSSVIDIGFSGADPQLTADVANAYVQAYLDTIVEIRTEPAKIYNAFFDQRTSVARQELEKAQRALSDYQRNKGIIVSDERVDVETARLNDLSSQLVRLQEVATETGGRDSEARARPDSSQEVLRDPVISTLRNELSRAQAELLQVSERLGPRHPTVIERTANIQSLRQRLVEQTRRVTESVGADRNVSMKRLAEVRRSLEEQRSKVAGLKVSRDEAMVLQRDIEHAQRTYEALLGRFTQTNLESQAAQTIVSVIRQASVPGLPSFPRVNLTIAVAFVFGCLLATAYIILRETANRRLRIPEDVTRNMQQPLLAVLPRIDFDRSESGRALGVKSRILQLSAPTGSR